MKEHSVKKTITAIILGVFFTLGFTTVASAKNDKEHKVWICHVPPGNPENRHAIEVDEHGWNGHDIHEDDFLISGKNDPQCKKETTTTSSTTTSTTQPTDTTQANTTTTEPSSTTSTTTTTIIASTSTAAVTTPSSQPSTDSPFISVPQATTVQDTPATSVVESWESGDDLPTTGPSLLWWIFIVAVCLTIIGIIFNRIRTPRIYELPVDISNRHNQE